MRKTNAIIEFDEIKKAYAATIATMEIQFEIEWRLNEFIFIFWWPTVDFCECRGRR